MHFELKGRKKGGRSLKGKTVFITITITLCLIIAGLGYYLYRQQLDLQTLANNYASLQQDHETLEQRHASLELEYNSLTSEYLSLRSEHDALVSEHESLQREYASLESQYQHLESRYNNIQDNYEKLRDTVNQRSQHFDVSDFITPKDLAVSQIVTQITGGWSDPSDWDEFWEDTMKMYDWVRDNIEYRSDGLYPVLPGDPSGSIQYSEEMWQFPGETLKLREGDCEDMAILLCSMIRYYNEEKYWTEVILIQGSEGAHAGVQLPVGEEELTILDPAGNYGSIISEDISTEINNWLNYWKPDLGSDVHVYRVFANYMDKTFSSTGEYISWMHARF